MQQDRIGVCNRAHSQANCSQVLEAFKVEHSGRDFTMQVVAGEIEFLEPPKLANLCRDCPSYVVVRQHTVEQMDTIKS